MTVDLTQARRFLDLLDPEAEAWNFRTIVGGVARKHAGTLDTLADRLQLDNGNGGNVYAVVNEGGNKAADITRIRAVFAEFDPPATAAMPAKVPLEPHIIVESSRGKHHAYWLVDGLPVEEFKPMQQAIIALLKSDPSVCDPSRIMRLPGFIHRKPADPAKGHDGQPFRTRIIHESGALPYTVDAIRAAFPAQTRPQAAAQGAPDRVVDVDRHADALRLGAHLGALVVGDGLPATAAMAAMQRARAEGRWTRDMPDDELSAAVAGAVDKYRSGEWNLPRWAQAMPAANDDHSRAERLADALTPWSDAELDAAREPHPHVFSGTFERVLFPVGEVTVVGAKGREGKTTVMLAVGTALAIEHSLAGMWPMQGRSVVIYSAEDDRQQYARKVAAQRALLSPEQAEQIKRRIIVPDLDAAGMEPLRRLVTVADRQPITTGTDAAIVEAISPLMQDRYPPALLIFETVATLTDAEEDNRAFSVLTDCLKRIARTLRLAVVLVHHTSQAADACLPDLSISTAMIRGGTALISNSRQILLLLNLGSDADPFPDNDGRTILRDIVAPDCKERITGLIALDTSKGQDPSPVWFRWVRTDYGPAAVEVDPPDHIVGKSWRKVREMTMAERGSRRADAKASTREAGVDAVVRLVKELHAAGKQPTANAVSLAAGKSPTWATPYLNQAAIDGLVTSNEEKVPRTRGMKTVFHPVTDSTEAAA